MPRRKAASFDAQRGAIRDAAARLFADAGYASTSVADIAAACGVSKALLYHYYRDKEHLLHDIAESYVERLQRIVEEVKSESLPPAARMRQLIARFMHEYEHSATRHRVLVQDVKYLSKVHRARVVARQRAVVDGFAQVVEELSPAASAAALRKPLTMILFGMMNWTFTWFSERGPLRYDDLAPIVADLFIGGLGRLRGLPSGGPTPSARRPRARAPVMRAMA
ncbi:MAG TPA: TetR/AcrR family transcriptional regulator [Burkholderiaceae bacterium]|nr:TetR/AcrR family transcriptional regulator [Burkholderiaceae bacterium]HQR76685.1 TetR/AcrR family transcriptional regulator [Burkholderiaceae bacterium]